MNKNDIVRENLCIKKIITVTKGENPHHHKMLTVKSRHSDALVYIISGSCTYRFGDKTEFKATEGDVFYLPYQSMYRMYIHTADYKFIFCDFEFEQNRLMGSSIYHGLKNIDSLFVKLLNRYNSASRNTYAECMSILYSIYSALGQSAELMYVGKDKKGDIMEAKRYMEENLGNVELSISALAQKAEISEVYFRKLFKAQYGISPSKYLILIRLKNAKKLMKYPFLALEECALQSGFSSLQYFCRLFKKETGISPGKYRKNL